MLPRPLCPLCRIPFQPSDVRRLHVDKTALPPATPAIASGDLDENAAYARQLQSGISHVVLGGAARAELSELLTEVRKWLNSQPSDEVCLRLRLVMTRLTTCP